MLSRLFSCLVIIKNAKIYKYIYIKTYIKTHQTAIIWKIYSTNPTGSNSSVIQNVLHGEHCCLHSQRNMCQKHPRAVPVQLHGQEDPCRSVSAWIRETDAADSDVDLSGWAAGKRSGPGQGQQRNASPQAAGHQNNSRPVFAACCEFQHHCL